VGGFLELSRFKKIPNDLLLVASGLFVGVLYLWTQQSCVYTRLDWLIFLGTFVSIIGIPMIYSSIVHYKGGDKDAS